MLGARSDDVEVGCGGAALSLAERPPRGGVRRVVCNAPSGSAEGFHAPKLRL